MKAIKTCAVAVGLVALTGVAQAALQDRGSGLIYDTTRNITWLADMNFAFTSGYAAANSGGFGDIRVESSGRMGWKAAFSWADQLVYGGFNDWRLPTVNPADATCTGGFSLGYGFNCTGGELSGLFVTDLGAKANESVLDPTGDTPEQVANVAMFSNVAARSFWSGTEFAPVSGFAWFFAAGIGIQDNTQTLNVLYAVAVRTGDVAVVPEPKAFALLLLGLGALMAAVRQRPR